MEFDQLLRERVLCANMIIDVARIDLNCILALIDYFLKMFILLVQSLDIAIDGRETILEVVDLVVKDLVMGMHGHLAVNQGIHALGHFHKVLGVQLFKLLHQDLWRGRHITSHALEILLLLELLLLGVRLSDLLVAPSSLSHWLLLSHSWNLRRLHEQCRASVCNRLNEREVSPPLLDRTGLKVHGLLIDVGQGH